MAPLLLAGGLLLASLPALLRRLGRRIEPAEWAQLCLFAVVGGAVLVQLGALLWAAPTLLRAAGVPAIAMACDRLLGPLLPLGTVGGVVAIIVATLVPLLAWRGHRRMERQHRSVVVEPGLGHHESRDGYELVVLPTAHSLAYSVANPSQVVVSEGLCTTLSDAELEAVVAHETAHLAHRHPQQLAIAAVAAAALRWWPLTTRSNLVLRTAFERWADEAATAGDHERRLALRDALVAAVMADQSVGVAAFSLAEATAERVEAMQHRSDPRLAPQLALYAAGALGAVLIGAATGTWMDQAQMAFAMAGRCTF